MADMLQFDLVSPERKLASGKARAVQIPGADGDLTAMPDHTPTITTLRPGVLVVEGATGEERFRRHRRFRRNQPRGDDGFWQNALSRRRAQRRAQPCKPFWTRCAPRPVRHRVRKKTRWTRPPMIWQRR